MHVADRIELREAVRVRVRRSGAAGRPALEFQSGDALTRSTGEWVTLERRIDRENDRYYERIVDKGGHLLREVDEPLSQRTGRGVAKRNVDEPPAQPPS